MLAVFNTRHVWSSRSYLLKALFVISVTVILLYGSGQPVTAQAQLTGLSATSDTPGTMSLTWDQPDESPSDYRVSWARSDDSWKTWTNEDWNAFPTTNSYSVEGLDGGVEYKARVRARYSDGSGPWSDPVTITVMAQEPEPQPPAKPQGLNGTVKHNQVSLSWDDPEDESITGYQVLRRDRSDEDSEFSVLAADTGSADTTYTDADVAAGERYAYRVRARNANGLSEASEDFNADLPQPPDITVTFGQAQYQVGEGTSVAVTLVLDRDPERDISIPVTVTRENGASKADHLKIPSEVAFQSGERQKSLTITATDDEENDDGESLLLGFGDLPHRVSAGDTSQATVLILNKVVQPARISSRQVDTTPALILSEGKRDDIDTINVDEMNTKNYEVRLATAPTGDVTVAVTHPATPDFSLTGASLTFTTDNWNTGQTVILHHSLDSDTAHTSLTVTHTASGGGYDGVTADLTVHMVDEEYEILVSRNFIEIEEGSSAGQTVGFVPSTFTTQDLTITITGMEGTRLEVHPSQFTLITGETVRFSAAPDRNTTDEVVTVTVTATGGEYDNAPIDYITVTLKDAGADPEPGLFAAPIQVTMEETQTLPYKLALTSEPTGDVTITTRMINFMKDHRLSGTEGRLITSENITFTSDNWDRRQDIGLTAVESSFIGLDYSADIRHTASGGGYDNVDLSGADVAAEVHDNAYVNLLMEAPRRVDEHAGNVTVQVKSVLYATYAPKTTHQYSINTHQVTAGSPRDFAAKSNLIQVRPGAFAWNGAAWIGTGDFVVTIHDDEIYEGPEAFKVVGSGAPGWAVPDTPDRICRAGLNEKDCVDITILDNDVGVTFDRRTQSIDEGDSVTVRINLSVDPERTVVVPIQATYGGTASQDDYRLDTHNVTFLTGETEKEIVFTAEDDDLDDDDESITLQWGTLPFRVVPWTTNQLTFNIVDDDDPRVKVRFEQEAYTVPEGDDTSSMDVTENQIKVKVLLDADPERTIQVPITIYGREEAVADTEADYTADQLNTFASSSDYQGVPSSLTFTAGQTEKEFTITAVDDTVDDDSESFRLGFGTLQDRVTEGDPASALVSITDDDRPASLTVNFEQDSYTVTEDNSIMVRVTLNDDPEGDLTIQLRRTNQGGASNTDYTGVPASVTFNAGDTVKSFTFEATDDTIDDDGESVKLTFINLPNSPIDVSAGAIDETVINITDDDVPFVQVTFANTTDTVREGYNLGVKVVLDADPERTVIIPLTATEHDGATHHDYTIPGTVTFRPGQTEAYPIFDAVQDNIDEDDERVVLRFGTPLQHRVTVGNPDMTDITITDDDGDGSPIKVTFKPPSWAEVSEGEEVAVTIVLSKPANDDVRVPLRVEHSKGLTDDDYSLPGSVLVTRGETEAQVTFTSIEDDLAENDEGALIKFHNLPSIMQVGYDYFVHIEVKDDDENVQTLTTSCPPTAGSGSSWRA